MERDMSNSPPPSPVNKITVLGIGMAVALIRHVRFILDRINYQDFESNSAFCIVNY